MGIERCEAFFVSSRVYIHETHNYYMLVLVITFGNSPSLARKDKVFVL